VTIGGKADLRLLPTPVLSFANVKVGDREAPDIDMDRFSAEVELTSLLKGEVHILQMRMERPRFRIDLGRLAAVGAAPGPAAGFDPERVTLARLQIVDGSAEIQDSRAGRSFRAERIQASIDATSLLGPGRLAADLVLEGQPLSLAVGFGRAEGAGLPLNLTLKSPLVPATLIANGDLSLRASEGPSFAGEVGVTGDAPPEGSEEPPSPWASLAAAGKFELTADAFKVEEARLSYGALERPLILEGHGNLAFGTAPHFDVSLAARQIDLDAALGRGGEPVAVESAVAALVAELPGLPLPSLPGALHLNAQGVVVGGSVIQAVGADLATAPEGWQVQSFAALLPGGTRVDVSGNLRTLESPSFRGHAKLASPQPAALAAWWRGRAGSAATLDHVSVEADLELEAGRQVLTSIAASTGEGTVRGSVELHRFAGPGELFANVTLEADRADLVEARALAELVIGRLSPGGIDQMTLSLRADALSAGGIEARSVLVEGGLERGRLQLRRLSVGDLAGASLEASGTLDDLFGAPAGELEASVKAADLTGAADFLAGLLPDNPAVAHLQAMAPSLSPVEADVSASVRGGDEPLSLSLTGSFADTHVVVKASGRGSPADPQSLDGELTLHVDSEDTGRVLGQIGLSPVPVETGPLRLDGSFKGALASGGSLNIEGSLAGLDLTYSAETHMTEGRVAFAGPLTAKSDDIDPLLLLAGIAVPGVGEGHAASAAGRLDFDGRRFALALTEGSFDEEPVAGALQVGFREGAEIGGRLQLEHVSLPFLAALGLGDRPVLEAGKWSDRPFAAPLPDGLALDLTLAAGHLDLGLAEPAAEAEVALRVGKGVLNIDLARASFAGGELKGAAALTIADGEARGAIRAALSGTELQRLVWESGGLPAASGLLDASFDVTGGGRSLAGFVSTLSGNGALALSEGRLNSLNPEALGEAMQAAEADAVPQEAAIRTRFEALFGSGALSFGRAAGSFSVAGGVVVVPTVSVEADGVTVLADASIDLNELSLSSAWTVRSTAPEPRPGAVQPAVRILFSGLLAAPRQTLDLNPLMDVLNARYLQRQLDEIEALQAAQKRAEEARRKAAEEQKRREEEARRREEQALRLEAEARRLEEEARMRTQEAERLRQTPPDLQPPSGPAPEPGPAAPQAVPQPAPGEPAARASPTPSPAAAGPDVVDQLGAAIQDMMNEGQGAAIPGSVSPPLPPPPAQP
jgi:hypothetical protein